MKRATLLACLAVSPALAQPAPPPVIVLDAADLRALDTVVQTSIPPAYSARLVEWINAMLKRQADKAKEPPHE